jgi:hypothetical protein
MPDALGCIMLMTLMEHSPLNLLGHVVSSVIAVCKPAFSALPGLMYDEYTPLRFSKTPVFAAR